MMSLRFFLLLLFQFSVSGILAINNEDPTAKTMEDFSGYLFHEPTDYPSAPPNSLLSFLRVDTTTLQNQIDELSTLSDTPAPSVTRILYTEKDVLARR